MDLVTVIVPTFNADKFICKCIDSILKQSYQEMEILIIDDGSTDGTENICKKYQEKDGRVRYLYQNNGGVSKARNYGIREAQGKYIAFVDADDYIESNMIEMMVSYFMRIKKTDLVVCGFYECNTSKRIEKKIECKKCLSQSAYLQGLFNPNSFGGFLWNKLFRADIIKENQLKLDEDIFVCEDLLFCYRYGEYVDEVQFVPQSFYNYIVNENSATHSEYSSKRFTAVTGFERMEHLVVRYGNKELKQEFDAHYIIICIQLFKRLIKKYKTFSNEEIQKIMSIVREKDMSFLTSAWPYKYKGVYIIMKILSLLFFRGEKVL